MTAIAERTFVVLVARLAQCVARVVLMLFAETRPMGRVEVTVTAVAVGLHVASPAEILALEACETCVIALDELGAMWHA